MTDEEVTPEEEEAGQTGGVSSGHSLWLGSATEHLVAATVAMAGRNRINVAQTLWDAEGIDLYLDGPAPASKRMLLQVKSISTEAASVRDNSRARARVREKTFQVRGDIWILVVVADLAKLTFEKSWLIPSADFDEKTVVDPHGYRWFVDSLNSRKSKWTRYRTDTRAAFAQRIVDHLDANA